MYYSALSLTDLIKGWRSYPRKRLWLATAMVPVVALIVATPVTVWHNHVVSVWHGVMDQLARDREIVHRYQRYETYLGDPNSLYNVYKLRGLFLPLSRSNLLVTLRSMAEAADGALRDVKVYPSRHMEPRHHGIPLEMTPIKIILHAYDDRCLYDFMGRLKNTPSFLWMPRAFSITYVDPYFELTLKGDSLKFLPFTWRHGGGGL